MSAAAVVKKKRIRPKAAAALERVSLKCFASPATIQINLSIYLYIQIYLYTGVFIYVVAVCVSVCLWLWLWSFSSPAAHLRLTCRSPAAAACSQIRLRSRCPHLLSRFRATCISSLQLQRRGNIPLSFFTYFIFFLHAYILFFLSSCFWLVSGFWQIA